MKEKTFRNLRMEGWRKARNGTRLTALALALALSAFSVWTVCYRFGREAPAYLPEASETSTVILLFLAFAVIFLCWRFANQGTDNVCSNGYDYSNEEGMHTCNGS